MSQTTPSIQPSIEHVVLNDLLFAIIIPAQYQSSGVEFFTDGDFSQQLGYMQHDAGKKIPPHMHQAIQRNVKLTQEVLVIRKGKLRVDFYDLKTQAYVESRMLNSGDIILLANGGHGFEVIEPTQMIEVKQGPYLGADDKVYLKEAPAEQIVIK